MPTQLVISYLRFTVASHDRQQTIPRQFRKNRDSPSDGWGGPEGRIHTEFAEATEFSDRNRPSVLLCEPRELCVSSLPPGWG